MKLKFNLKDFSYIGYTILIISEIRYCAVVYLHVYKTNLQLNKNRFEYISQLYNSQTCQPSRIRREIHAFKVFLTLSRLRFINSSYTSFNILKLIVMADEIVDCAARSGKMTVA